MKHFMLVLLAVAMSYGATIRGLILVDTSAPGQQFPESGVLVTLSPTGGTTTTWDSIKIWTDWNTGNTYQWNYEVTVPNGWSGTVTPSKLGKAFKKPRLSDVTSYTNLTGTVYCNFKCKQAVGIEGEVWDSLGRGLEGVIVYVSFDLFPECLECTGPATRDTSGSDGIYHLTLYPGWKGVLWFKKPGFYFEPGDCSHSYYTPQYSSIFHCNWTARRNTYGIRGTITNASASVSNVVVSLGGGYTYTTNASGQFLLVVPYGVSGNVTPTKAGMRFTPVSYPINTVIWESGVIENDTTIGDRDTTIDFTGEDITATSVRPIAHQSVLQSANHVPTYNLLGERILTPVRGLTVTQTGLRRMNLIR